MGATPQRALYALAAALGLTFGGLLGGCGIKGPLRPPTAAPPPAPACCTADAGAAP